MVATDQKAVIFTFTQIFSMFYSQNLVLAHNKPVNAVARLLGQDVITDDVYEQIQTGV